MIHAFFNIFFWSGYEQAGGTFNLFAEYNTDRHTLLGNFPASWFQSVPALYIVLFTSLISIIWKKLGSISKEPRTPVIFGIGLILMSIGFVIMKSCPICQWRISCLSCVAYDGIFYANNRWVVSFTDWSFHGNKACTKKNSIGYDGNLYCQYCLSKLSCRSFSKYFTYLSSRNDLFTFLTITTLTAGLVLLIISPLLNRMMRDIT